MGLKWGIWLLLPTKGHQGLFTDVLIDGSSSDSRSRSNLKREQEQRQQQRKQGQCSSSSSIGSRGKRYISKVCNLLWYSAPAVTALGSNKRNM